MEYTDFIKECNYLAQEYDSIEIVCSDDSGTIFSIDLEEAWEYKIDMMTEDNSSSQKFMNLEDAFHGLWLLVDSIGQEWVFLF